MKTVRFLHTSDWQLGARFGWIAGDKGALLRAERLAAVERIGEMAGRHEVDFVIVCGDLFDAHTIDNEVVTRSLEMLGRFPVPVFAIPGNHDFAGAPESVYKRRRFADRCPDNFHVLDAALPLALDGLPVTLLPCPLIRRHTVEDPTRWLRSDAAGSEAGQIRIALAHGSVLDFDSESSGVAPNLIDAAVAEEASLDYLALGDWHGARQISEKVWYSGTPEPDRFKDNQSGHVLLVEIDRPHAMPRIQVEPSSGCSWIRHDAALYSEEDVTALERWFADLPSPQKTLVRLECRGVLGMKAKLRLDWLLETQAELLLHLRKRGTEVLLRPTDEELTALGSHGLTGRVADSLKVLANREGEEGKVAGLSLQLLFQMMQG